MKITGISFRQQTTVAALVLLVSTSSKNIECDAFAPVHHPSFPRLTAPSQVVADSASATALHANLVDRFARVAKANLNNILMQFEDPEKVMTQALDDMQTDLVRVRQTYAEVTATQRRMANSKRQLESQADDWYRRAQLALKKDNEGLAREALARREALLNQASIIQGQIDAQANNLDTLYEGMQALEKKILEAASRKNEMAARAKTAKSTQKINDMLSGLTGKTSMDAFNKMEEKVLALEAAAEVSNEMAKTMMSRSLPSSSKGKDSSSTIELQFRALESSDAVDKEMEKLKAKMLPAWSKKIPVSEISTVKAKEKSLDYLSY
ncbi:phage shock protein A PspA family protein [Nitzschia inconspicua]|uniref:Phage shock protein A PspA family protein n=1 Tax=Nitzschia inconspicua TaxID=303405 RepID=A0A9K3M213_9STRA|nr:phage shock protein A PspA family protein [Nitzschia inconspicua]